MPLRLQRIRPRNKEEVSSNEVLYTMVEYYHAVEGVKVQQCAPVKAVCIMGPDGTLMKLRRKQEGKDFQDVTAYDLKK